MSKARPSHAQGSRISLKVHAADNVATLLDSDLECCALADGLSIVPGIPFGHKVAVADIGAGEAVIKYGVVIGHATSAIAIGGHVHVHNIV